MSKSETVKRYVLFIISLFFAALGVAFTKRGELGVFPISPLWGQGKGRSFRLC